MEQAKIKLRMVSIVDRYRRIELLSIILKILPVVLYVILAPFAIWYQVLEKELFITLILALAEVLLLFKLRSYIVFFVQHKDLENCRLYQSVLQPEIVTEIFVYNDRISVDIKGAENYVVYLREGELKDEFLSYCKEYFGEDKLFIK